MSNSKLTAGQKQERKNIMRTQPPITLLNSLDYNCTIAIWKTVGNMGQFSVSICSNSEEKFRRKVGEYHALVRAVTGQVSPVYIGDNNILDVAVDIASIIGRYYYSE